MIDFSSPLAGMERAAAAVDQTARRLAGQTAPSAQRRESAQAPQTEDKVDLSAEIVALIGARNSFKANAQAFRVEDEISQSTISLLA